MHIDFRPIDIFNALKNAKTGKACEVDGLAAEHFIYADAIINVHVHIYLYYLIVLFPMANYIENL